MTFKGSVLSILIFGLVGLFVSCAKDDQIHGSGDFKITSGNATLAGNLELPKTAGPYPVAIVVHGSGRVTGRDVKILFRDLPAKGIALLTYDKRGVGKSTGSYDDVNPGSSEKVFKLLASDVLAWVDFLKKHGDINPRQIGLVGASQAGWIIPLAASMSADVQFIVNAVGPTVSIGKQDYYSHLTQEKIALSDGTINGFSLEFLNESTKKNDVFAGFDPVPSIASLNIPGLWIYSELDELVPTLLCIEILNEIKNGKSKDFTIQVLPKANHHLIDITTGQQIEFVKNEGGVADWIKSHVIP